MWRALPRNTGHAEFAAPAYVSCGGVLECDAVSVDVLDGDATSVVVTSGDAVEEGVLERDVAGVNVPRGDDVGDDALQVAIVGVPVAVWLEVLLGRKTLSKQGRATPDWAVTGTAV